MSAGRPIKCIVVGDRSVGKTCLLMTYATGRFPEEYVYGFGFNSVKAEVDNTTVTLSLWDTAGLEDYNLLRPLFYPQTDVFLICFSIVDQSSLDHGVKKWFTEIKYYCPYAHIMLVGMKIDLREDSETLNVLCEQGLSPITRKQGQKMANKIKAVKYLECSSLTQKGLKLVFDEVVRAVNSPVLSRECAIT